MREGKIRRKGRVKRWKGEKREKGREEIIERRGGREERMEG